MDERPKLPHYDPDYCHKVAKWASVVCIATLAVELAILLLVTHKASCPGWTMYAKTTGQATHLWLFAVVITGGTTAGICYVVLRWKEKFAAEIYDNIAFGNDSLLLPYFGFRNRLPFPPEQGDSNQKKELNFEQILLVDSNFGFLFGCAAWCLFGAIPLFMMVTSCTDVLEYFWY